MPDYTKEESFQKVLKSRQYLDLPPEDRKEFLTILQGLTPQERTQLASGLEQGTVENPQKGPSSEQIGQAVDEFLEPARPTPAKVAQMGMGMLFGAGSGAVATKLAGQVASPLLKKVIPPVVEAAGNYLGNQASKATGLQEGTPFTTDTSDVLSVGIPLAYRAGAGLAKATTRPAQRAIREAEETNAALQSEYAQKAADADLTATRHVAKVDADTAAKNAKAMQAWREERQKILDDFRQDLEDNMRRTDATNAERQQGVRDAMARRDQRLTAHNEAASVTIPNLTTGITIDDYRPAYAASKRAAARAPEVDVSPLNAAAQAEGLDLANPVDPRNPMAGVLRRLQAWQVRQPDPNAPASGLLGPNGQPIKNAPQGPTSIPAALGDLIEVHQELGRTLGRLEGKQYAAGRSMYQKVGQMLQDEAARSPEGAEAVSQHFEGQRLWSRNRTREEIEMHGRNAISSPSANQYEVRSRGLRDNVSRMMDPKENQFHDAFTPAEWQKVSDQLDRLPPRGIGGEVLPARPKNYNFREAEVKRDRRLAETATPPEAIPPNYGPADYPATRPMPPEPVSPDLGNFPVGKAIMGKVAGGMAGGLAAEAMGLPTYHGIVAGSALGAAATAGPWLISKLMLRGEAGQQAVRSIMAGKKAIGQAELALLTQAAKQLGIDTNE